jgi:catechol 2,3-dioxygenase-like lactoylglutathione lyase family enzyme
VALPYDVVVDDVELVAPSGAREGPAVAVFISADLDRSEAFYASIGFVCDRVAPGYLLLWRGSAMLHVAELRGFDPLTQNSCAALVVTDDVDAVAAQLRDAGLWVVESVADRSDRALTAELRRRCDAGESLARMGPVQERPWGARELALLDPDNNLLRFATLA